MISLYWRRTFYVFLRCSWLEKIMTLSILKSHVPKPEVSVMAFVQFYRCGDRVLTTWASSGIKAGAMSMDELFNC